jgi:pseudouridine-5'-phosphate glycosidase
VEGSIDGAVGARGKRFGLGAPSSALGAFMVLSDEVAEAILDRHAVVALESTLISHGFPYPENLAIARESEAAVRSAGAVPATVAIHDGRFLVGLTPDALEELATARGVAKVARPTLAAALARGGWGATTVSATMIAADVAGIAVFATGGIGGVHRGALVAADGSRGSLDISADLDELARTPVVVVCAGPKAILDVRGTLEVLESRGVPVVSVGTDELPGFFSRASGIRAPQHVADVAGAADVARTHLALGLGSGVLLCVPVPAADELPREEAEAAIGRATEEADGAGIHGPALTPWVLQRVAELTDGRSIRANTALIVNNARFAGRLAATI